MTALLLALVLAGGTPPIGPPALDRALVVSVHDGDTVRVLFADGHRESVRLLGIDAPELGRLGFANQPGATKAKRALERLVLGKTVDLVADPAAGDRDSTASKRLLRFLYAGADDVSLLLVERGFARADGVHRYGRRDDLCVIEAQARSRRVGIWRLRKNAKPSQCRRGERA